MRHFFLTFSLLFIFASLSAVTTVTVNVNVNVVCLDAIAVSSSPPPFVFAPKYAGQAFCQAIDQSTTYAVTTNNYGRSIYGMLNKELPPGLFLNVHFAPPCGATSWGAVPLNTANNRIVGGISQIAEGSLAITYIMTAEASLPSTFDSHIITYTIGP